MGTSHQSFYFNQDSHLHIMPNMLQVSYTTNGYGLYDDGHFAAQWSIPILPIFNPMGPELNACSDLKKATLQMGVAESSSNLKVNILSMTLCYIHITFKAKMLNG